MAEARGQEVWGGGSAAPTSRLPCPACLPAGLISTRPLCLACACRRLFLFPRVCQEDDAGAGAARGRGCRRQKGGVNGGCSVLVASHLLQLAHAGCCHAPPPPAQLDPPCVKFRVAGSTQGFTEHNALARKCARRVAAFASGALSAVESAAVPATLDCAALDVSSHTRPEPSDSWRRSAAGTAAAAAAGTAAAARAGLQRRRLQRHLQACCATVCDYVLWLPLPDAEACVAAGRGGGGGRCRDTDAAYLRRWCVWLGVWSYEAPEMACCNIVCCAAPLRGGLAAGPHRPWHPPPRPPPRSLPPCPACSDDRQISTEESAALAECFDPSQARCVILFDYAYLGATQLAAWLAGLWRTDGLCCGTTGCVAQQACGRRPVWPPTALHPAPPACSALWCVTPAATSYPAARAWWPERLPSCTLPAAQHCTLCASAELHAM